MSRFASARGEVVDPRNGEPIMGDQSSVGRLSLAKIRCNLNETVQAEPGQRH